MTPTLPHPKEAAEALDLLPIRLKFMAEHDKTEDEALVIERDYRGFFSLLVLLPDVPLVPSRWVDEFWHIHILFMKKYEEDCLAAAGHLLYHHPYFGLQPKHVIDVCAKHLRRMPALFQEHLGYNPPTYANLEQELAQAYATQRLTSERGISGSMDLSLPENAGWL